MYESKRVLEKSVQLTGVLCIFLSNFDFYVTIHHATRAIPT